MYSRPGLSNEYIRPAGSTGSYMLCCSLPCRRREWREYRHNWESLIAFWLRKGHSAGKPLPQLAIREDAKVFVPNWTKKLSFANKTQKLILTLQLYYSSPYFCSKVMIFKNGRFEGDIIFRHLKVPLFKPSLLWCLSITYGTHWHSSNKSRRNIWAIGGHWPSFIPPSSVRKIWWLTLKNLFVANITK